MANYNQEMQKAEDSVCGFGNDPAVKTASELVRLKEQLGINLKIWDANLHRISATIENIPQLLRSPEFIAALKQKLYCSGSNDSTWFSLSVRNGRIESISFLLSITMHWIRAINKKKSGFDALVVGYSPGIVNVQDATAVVTRDNYTPDRILKCFPQLIGQTAAEPKEVGKLLCFLISNSLNNLSKDMLQYVGDKQGYAINVDGKLQFNPPPACQLRSEFESYLTPAVRNRQNPGNGSPNHDPSPILAPMIAGQKEMQIAVLQRSRSHFQFLFAACRVPEENIFVAKPTKEMPSTKLVPLFKNTRYDDPTVPPLGPKIKRLTAELNSVNDGNVVVVDSFCADQTKMTEKGLNLLVSDVSGATDSERGSNHTVVLISKYADNYIPKEHCCVLEFKSKPLYSAEDYKNVLRKLDADLAFFIVREFNNGNLSKAFREHVEKARQGIDDRIPPSKRNTWIQLKTVLQFCKEWFGPLFCPDIEQIISDWLISQEQDKESLVEKICAEFSEILNRRISEGSYPLICKEEVTPYVKGSHMLIVDHEKQCLYIETGLTDEIASDSEIVSNPDTLKSALYEAGFIPHNGKNEKSVRIAAQSSDKGSYPLHVQALSFALLTKENKQRLDLIDKEPFLLRTDEFPADGFLPILKTVDGRFAGKKLNFEDESSHHYLGSGRSGSGKTWKLVQLMPMLWMLNCNVATFDTSGSSTEVQLRRMLPGEVVDRMFRFIHIGAEQDRIPVNLGSLAGCISLPDRKRLVYSLLSAAVGKFDRDRVKDNQQRAALKSYLSQYLKDKHDHVDFVKLTEKLRSSSVLSPRVSEVLCSVFQDIADIGCEEQGWDDLFSDDNRILVLDLGNEVGDSSHVLLDILVASLYGWQYQHNERQLAIFIDELADQNFAEQSPLNMILKQGRKQHIMLLGATQDYFSQGNSNLDVMKQATIKSYARPGKSEDRIAEKLGFSNAIAAGFHQFKPGDVIVEFDAYNKDTGENEPVTLRGRVVNFIETPLYDRFLREYGSQENLDDTASSTIIPETHGFVNQNGGKNHETTISNG